MCLNLCGSLGQIGNQVAAGYQAQDNTPFGGGSPDIFVIAAVYPNWRSFLWRARARDV